MEPVAVEARHQSLGRGHGVGVTGEDDPTIAAQCGASHEVVTDPRHLEVRMGAQFGLEHVDERRLGATG